MKISKMQDYINNRLESDIKVFGDDKPQGYV